MKTSLTGRIRGNVIELNEPAGLPDGQEVRVAVEPLVEDETLAPGEGIRRSAGGWADDSEDGDDFVEWYRQQRHLERREIEP